MKKKLLTIGISLFLAGAVNTANAQTIYALTSTDQLFKFEAANPAGTATTPAALSGLLPGITIVGMDYRPATGQLYALGYNPTLQIGQLYTINVNTSAATAVGSPLVAFALDGKTGMDFNPTVDRIRVVTSAGQDYRLHPVTGALVATDGTLAYNAGDVNTGVKPNIGSCAYTNSYIGATATTLFDYDDSLNILVIQNPPNNGILNTVGSSGIVVNQANATSDLDIFYDATNQVNLAYLVANTGSSSNDDLYTLNLSTGMATLVGAIGPGFDIKDIAVLIDRSAPAPSGRLVYGVTTANSLISFYTGNSTYLRSSVPVTGLLNGETLVGTDFRPATGSLYGLGYNAVSNVARIYTIQLATAVATPVSGDSVSTLDLSGNIGFDFNPTVDRIRVITSNGKNYRLHPVTGLIAANDTDLNYAAGDANNGKTPRVGTGAYTNSFAGTTGTTLYVYDDSLNILATQVPPNQGVLNTIGSSGIVVNSADRTSDLDIFYDKTTATNIAYIAANTTGNNDKLYTINLSTGATTEVGMIGFGIPVRDIAVPLDTTVVGIAPVRAETMGFGIYPNPLESYSTLVFETMTAVPAVIRVMDLTGRLVATVNDDQAAPGVRSIRWNTDQLLPGVYIVQLTVGDRSSSLKVVK